MKLSYKTEMYIAKFLDKLFQVTTISYLLIGMGYYFATSDLYPYWKQHLIGIGLTAALRDFWLEGRASVPKEELENYGSWVKDHHCDYTLDGYAKVRRRVLLESEL